ncbi:MAG: DNA translocase FtsK [Chloroflexota bacterium]|nr:DNA translocase FtsK [Chloroflexota bacterium]
MSGAKRQKPPRSKPKSPAGVASRGRSKQRKNSEGRPLWKRFFSFLALPVVRRIILVVVIIGLLYVWGNVMWERMLTLFGVGFAIIVIAIGALIWVVWRGRFSSTVKHWNWVVGGISLALALWGILSFFTTTGGVLSSATLGGRFGQIIIGAADFMGGLRITVLVILGVVFLVPRKILYCLKSAWHSITGVSAQGRAPRRKVPSPLKENGLSNESRPGLPSASEGQGRSEYTAPEVKPAVIPEANLAVAQVKQSRGPIITPGGWQLPPIDILSKATEIELDKDDIEKQAALIEESLASYGVEAKVVQINTGPTVTQFGVEPGWDRKYKEIKEKGKDGTIQTRWEEVSRTRIRVDRITSLANDLSLALAAPSIRIEAPVPGKSIVGLEVPNTVFGSVNLRSVIESTAFQRSKAKSKLAVALGKGAGGESVAADLAKMPHLLIAGATGSGKTVCLNSVICCLLLHNSPDDVQFIMIDPKRVELVDFNSIPHLIAPVVVDTSKAVKALRWLAQEMDNRYHQFAQVGARNIEGYNKDRLPEEGMPYLVLVIDELADLMMAAFDEVEHTLCRLAQLARATGIHIIVATQRPSVDVVTGLIKANFPTRISFAVTSQVDSRTILDMVGAEKLLGRGDMLYMPTEAGKPKRLQGTFLSDAEIERLVYFWGNQQREGMGLVNFDEIAEVAPHGQKVAPLPDSLFEEAKRLTYEHEHVSASFLQRRLRIGYPRAARLMEALGEAGLLEATSSKEEK